MPLVISKFCNLCVFEDMKMIPVENYGVKCMSMGLLVEKDAPIVWRGPMVCLSFLRSLRKP